MKQESDNEQFAKVVEALRPWLSAVVIAGGWAHRLHRMHALAEALGYLPLMTKDVDVALGSPSALGEANMRLAARQKWTTSARQEWTTCRTGLARANLPILTVQGCLRKGTWCGRVVSAATDPIPL